jgi:hypothetical protein
VSTDSSRTEYVFNFSVDHNNTQADGSFMLPDGIGVDDELAFALLKAINGVPWPTGITKPFAVYKNSYVDTNFTTDTAAVPPVFT